MLDRVQSTSTLAVSQEMVLCQQEEADLRVWRLVKQTTATTILIHSPDTDVYNIGLSTIQENKEVIVQVNVPQSTTQLYVHLTS